MEEVESVEFWNKWWEKAVEHQRIGWYRGGLIQAPLVEFRGRLWDIANNEALLREIMAASGVRTVLYAGVGISREPRRLARAGFDVTAVDISPVAMRLLERLDEDEGMSANGKTEVGELAGRLEYVTGNFMDADVCPGPYDVVIERRTVQLFPDDVRACALSSLASRLKTPGIFFTHCNDSEYGQGKPKLFHASQEWFQAAGWTIWDHKPESLVINRTAWLVHSAS